MAISKERIDKVFEEISKYKIELAPDPTVLGAKYLQDQIATCRNYTNNVTVLLNQIHRERMSIDANVRRKETAFKIASDELLSKNAQVRNLPNIADRQAQINIMLREEHREIEDLRNDVRELDHLEKMVKITHRELKDTMAEIKLQRALIRDELDSGRMYGDERNSEGREAGKSDSQTVEDIDEDEIDRLLRGDSTIEDPLKSKTSEETTTPEAAPESEVIETVTVSDEDQVQSFLAIEAPAPVPVSAEDEFGDLLLNV